MAKYYGKIGYAETVETKPGVYENQYVEREYYGEVIRRSRRLQTSENLNDDIVITNDISIIADQYALNDFSKIRYAEYMGVKWKVTSVDVLFPRLTLTLGEVYNV